MAKAIGEFRRGGYGFHYGVFSLGLHGRQTASVRQAVHDGDTVSVRTEGNFGVRFLGIDTAEVSFKLPGGDGFPSIRSPAWSEFLDDPFDRRYDGEAPLKLSRALKKHLQAKVGPGCAENHARHAELGQRALEEEMLKDIAALGQTNEDFALFLVFAYEVMDGYGRLLAFLNASAAADKRPALTYNERQMLAGVAYPYFIWPNINPFRKKPSVFDAVVAPGAARDEAQADRSLRLVRGAIADARAAGKGIFDCADPLRLAPFELRFLAQRRPPSRWVIDMSKNDEFVIPPQEYMTVQPEDRLFVAEEFVPLFQKKGWKKG